MPGANVTRNSSGGTSIKIFEEKGGGEKDLAGLGRHTSENLYFWYFCDAEIVKFCLILTHLSFWWGGGGGKLGAKKKWGGGANTLMSPCGAATAENSRWSAASFCVLGCIVTPRMRDCRNYVISASVYRNCVISRVFGSRHLAKIMVFRQSPSCRNHGITAKNSQISAFSWCYWYLVRFMSLVAYRRTALNPLLKHY